MKKILYLGLRPPADTPHERYIHFPVIAIEPVEWSGDLCAYTHLIFTSPTAVSLLLEKTPAQGKKTIAVGHATAAELRRFGHEPMIAEEETAEGVVELLSLLNLKGAHLFWPHSGQARRVISDYCKIHSIQLTESILYQVIPVCPRPLPIMEEFDEVLFTSPSTVDAFLRIFPKLPGEKCRAIGPVTLRCLHQFL